MWRSEVWVPQQWHRFLRRLLDQIAPSPDFTDRDFTPSEFAAIMRRRLAVGFALTAAWRLDDAPRAPGQGPGLAVMGGLRPRGPNVGRGSGGALAARRREARCPCADCVNGLPARLHGTGGG